MYLYFNAYQLDYIVLLSHVLELVNLKVEEQNIDRILVSLRFSIID